MNCSRRSSVVDGHSFRSLLIEQHQCKCIVCEDKTRGALSGLKTRASVRGELDDLRLPDRTPKPVERSQASLGHYG